MSPMSTSTTVIRQSTSEYNESGLYLYFLGLSTRDISKAMFFLHQIKE
jgi:hypothetical protein